MTVKQLKEQLATVPDDAVVVSNDRDGWFTECSVDLLRACDMGLGQFWAGRESFPHEKKTVLLFG